MGGGDSRYTVFTIILMQDLVALIQHAERVERASGTFAMNYATLFFKAMGLCMLHLTAYTAGIPLTV